VKQDAARYCFRRKQQPPWLGYRGYLGTAPHIESNEVTSFAFSNSRIIPPDENQSFSGMKDTASINCTTVQYGSRLSGLWTDEFLLVSTGAAVAEPT
jgi:hypothetical protein